MWLKMTTSSDSSGSGPGELVGDEAGRAADVRHGQPGQVGTAEEVVQHAEDLAGLGPPLLLVEHLRLQLGVRELRLALIRHPPLHSSGPASRPTTPWPARSRPRPSRPATPAPRRAPAAGPAR